MSIYALHTPFRRGAELFDCTNLCTLVGMKAGNGGIPELRVVDPASGVTHRVAAVSHRILAYAPSSPSFSFHRLTSNHSLLEIKILRNQESVGESYVRANGSSQYGSFPIRYGLAHNVYTSTRQTARFASVYVALRLPRLSLFMVLT